MATNAITLTSASTYGKIDNFAGFDAITDGTMEGWFKQNASGGAYGRVLVLGTSVIGEKFRLCTENGTPSTGANQTRDYDGANNADGYSTNSIFPTATWVHIALVHDATNKKTYIIKNGVEINSYNLLQTGAGTIVSTSGSYFLTGVNTSLGEPFKGDVGGFIRIWNRALTAAEIYYNYDKILTPASETGLIVNCNFTEGSGTVVDNDATPGEDLDLYGTPSWTTGPTTTAKAYTYTYHFNQVKSSTDDAEENRSSTVMSLTSGDYEIPADGGVSQRIGWRFQSVAVPSGATIQAAYIRLVGESTQSGGPVVTVLAGNDVDDATTFTTTNGDISGRTATTATVNWSIGSSAGNTTTTSPDIKTIVQEIIDRAGWATGQDMAFMLDCTTSTGLYGRFYSWNGLIFSAAMLHIEYSTSSGPAGLKTWDGLVTASIKTIGGVAKASVKTVNGLA